MSGAGMPAGGTSQPGGVGVAASARFARGPVRWSGLLPIVLFALAASAFWTLFGNRIVQAVASEAATKALGTEVDIRGLDLRLLRGTLTIAQVEIADPFDVKLNLLELGPIVVGIQRRPLLEKKVVLDSFIVVQSRYHAPRAVPARPVAGRSLTRDVLTEVRKFTDKISVPPLQLLPIDTVRQLALHPEQLATVRDAKALDARADSLHRAFTAQYQALRLDQRLDSAKQLADRLKGQNPLSLGLAGAQRAVSELRTVQKSIEDLRVRSEKLASDAQRGDQLLRAGVASLDQAREQDYAFARGLLKLPSIEGPQLGNALFGQVSIDKFQQALYYAEVSKRYVPPGLLPREAPGPRRMRREGITVAFPRAMHYPAFHLRRALAHFAMNEGSVAARYAATVTNLSSEPDLVGAPMAVSISRDAAGADLGMLRASGVADHRTGSALDSVAGRATGIALSSFDLPGLPLTADLGVGDATFSFAMQGEMVRGVWALRAPQVRWVTRGAQAAGEGEMIRFATQVIAGIPTLSIRAELGGTIDAPVLNVRSDIDSAFAASLRQQVGAQLAKAEVRVRAEVDRLTAEPLKAVRSKVDDVRNAATRRVTESRARIDAQKKDLEDRLKGVSGGSLRIP